MKKFLSLALAAAMLLSVLTGCGSEESTGTDTSTSTAVSAAPATVTPAAPAPTAVPSTDEAADSTAAQSETAVSEKIALVTDMGNIDDDSFLQTCWEAVVAYSEENGIENIYYKPSEDSTDARVAAIARAVDEGATVVVLPGSLFGEAIGLTQDKYPNVKFIAIDLGEEALGGTVLASNTYSIVFHEEQAGYLAGYAAVMEGYTKLGFLGGMEIPAVQRYGFGYVQGIHDAARELDQEVELKYTYSGRFSADSGITEKMEGWYAEGTEVVFACGGGIYASTVEAANQHEGKVIGVDTDQSHLDPCIITSATKNLFSAAYGALDAYFTGKWDTVGGTIASLSLTEGDYVGLPTDTWSLESYSLEDYNKLVEEIKNGAVQISDSTEAMPEVDSHVTLITD